MPSVSIKNVPEPLLVRLRARASQHHRSLQGELLAILEAAVAPRPLTVEQLRQRIKELGLPATGDSTAMIREDRDAR
jgi:plasmid stability protein